MAMAQHRMLAWVWQGTEADRRTGFVDMSRFEFLAAGDRAQDPRVGGLHLKTVTRELWVDPDPPAPGERLIGTTVGIQIGVEPAAMISADYLPWELADGDEVKISAGWASIDGQWFAVRVVDAGLGQFQMLGADTTGETGTGMGATVMARTPEPEARSLSSAATPTRRRRKA